MEETLGARLSAARNAANMSQSQAGLRIGIERKTISGYETDYRQPSIDLLIKFARLYHVTTDYLLGIEKKPTIDCSGLSEKEKSIITELVTDLADKNARLKNTTR